MTCPFCAESIPDTAKRCSRCHRDLDERGAIRRTWTRARKSILVVFSLIGTALLTSWVVPFIARQLDRDRTLFETRLGIAQTIIERGTFVETRVNNLMTILAVFRKDARTMTPAQLQDAQREMRARMTEHYLEFERVAWWWFRKVQRDSEFPEPLSGDKKKELDRLSNEYRDALLKTTNAIDMLWDRLLREKPVAGNKDSYRELVKSQESILAEAGMKRRECITGMAHLFEQRLPARWFFMR